jgi:SAM-dependent methyltransferase
MSWNAGYVTDVNYTYGYYGELNADRAVFALQSVGIKPPTIRNACELGFGQGLSIAIHSATQPHVQWWGTDFNPSQAAFAQEMVAQAGTSAKLYDQAFAEFCTRDDLPEFEFIALHGIWTWISDENRAVVVDFVRRKLAVGGILYISYNTLPGWAAAAPLRHLMKQHGDVMGSPSALVTQRIDGALDFMEQLFGVEPAYARNNALAVERFKGLKTQDRNYMAHEYMNRDWRPMYFAELAEWLEPAKLTYATSANLLDQQDSVNMLPTQNAFLTGVVDPGFKETVRDYITGNQFRRDLWMRGVRRMAALEQAEVLRSRRFIMIVPRADVHLKLTAAQGEVTLQEAVYKPLLDFMSDHQIKTFAQIEVAMQAAGLGLGQVASALAIMTGTGALAVVQDDKVIAKAKPAVDKLNGAIVSMARVRQDIPYLASPVTGGTIAANRLEQLLLLGRAKGGKTRADWAKFAWEVLKSQGQNLVREGNQLEGEEDNIAELVERAEALEKRLPILKALGIV